MKANAVVQSVYEQVLKRNPGEAEFHQAVKEVLDSLVPVLEKHPEYVKAKIVDRLVEPERQFIFRVPWQDDKGDFQVNRGFRIQFNSALDHIRAASACTPASISASSSSSLRADSEEFAHRPDDGRRQGRLRFRPKGKSDGEVMRFCQSFMTELAKHIGPILMSRRRYRHRRSRGRLYVRPVQTSPQ